jgi:hypothetical protein
MLLKDYTTFGGVSMPVAAAVVVPETLSHQVSPHQVDLPGRAPYNFCGSQGNRVETSDGQVDMLYKLSIESRTVRASGRHR